MLAYFYLFSSSLGLVWCLSSVHFFNHVFLLRIFDYFLVNDNCDYTSWPFLILAVGECADLWTLLIVCNLYFLD